MFETKNEHSIQGAVIKSWFKGEIKMYECGHEPRKIFLKKTDVVWYHLYNQWKKSDSKLCFDCWNKKRKKDFLGKCKKVFDIKL